MLTLKEYQQRALDVLGEYFKACSRLDDADTAFYETTKKTLGTGIPYNVIKELPALPYVCIRIPTGGGKTLVACHTISTAATELLNTENPLVLWLVPSNAILEQTIGALQDRRHPYREAIEAAVGSINPINVKDALYITPATLNTQTTIIVSTIQAFRVDETEGRKVYEQSGHLMEHFTDLNAEQSGGLECYENGRPIPSLANVLRLRRPIVIVDEAHNARTDLSFEMLARFRPSCILEFTATPDTSKHPSNVLYTVSAAELKADEMIKLPIRLETRPGWKELLSDAIACRDHLEKTAQNERKETDEYIRPIMLLQAQPHSQAKDTLTVEVVEKCLIEDFNINPDEIRRATGTDRGLDGLDILAADCKVRYIITVQALKEGWDCPFAYVLCTVAELKSSTAVEQIIGRVLRMPKAKRKNNEDLNIAYAFATSQQFYEAASKLEEALVQNGFNRQEAKELIKPPATETGDDLFSGYRPSVVIKVDAVPDLSGLPGTLKERISYDTQSGAVTVTGRIEEHEVPDVAGCFGKEHGKKIAEELFFKSRGLRVAEGNSPAERGEPFNIPALAVKNGDIFELFDDTHFSDTPWMISDCDAKLTEAEYSSKRPPGQVGIIDVSEEGRVGTQYVSGVQEDLDQLVKIDRYTSAGLVHWLDRKIPHPDVTPVDSGIFLTSLMQGLIEERGFSIEQLFHDKYRLRTAVEKKMDECRKAALTKSYQACLLEDFETPLTVTPETCFTFKKHQYPYKNRCSHHFNNHYFPHAGDLQTEGEEFECARFIDSLPEVKYWVRNIERSVYSFWLQTSTDKFYPDFVCLLKDGRYLVVEYKGADRWSNDDSKEKRAIGELWELRSGGKCLFIMPKGKDLEAVRAKVR